jgi:flavin-dependent dehydrogenase
MTVPEYDRVVIGSGRAGHGAAIGVDKLRKTVAVVDHSSMIGGVCVRKGRIPSRRFENRFDTSQGAAIEQSTDGATRRTELSPFAWLLAVRHLRKQVSRFPAYGDSLPTKTKKLIEEAWWSNWMAACPARGRKMIRRSASGSRGRSDGGVSLSDGSRRRRS